MKIRPILDSLAVGRASMIEPARAVAAAAAIDHAAIRQTKKKRVSGDAFTSVPTYGLPPARQFTPVLEHALTRCKRSHREHALSMN